MNSRCETNSIALHIMDCVVELHKDVAEDVHVSETWLVDVELHNTTLALTSFVSILVHFSLHPMVRWHVVLYTTNDISQVSHAEELIITAINFRAIIFMKLGEMFGRES